MDEITVQEIERKKKYLKRYKKNVALISRLQRKVNDLDRRSKSLKFPTLSDMPRGGEPITAYDLTNEKIELEQRIDRLTSKGDKLKAEILDCIDTLDDPRYAEILESFLIDLKDFDIIADENGYTERHVRRLYSEGLGAINIKCQ